MKDISKFRLFPKHRIGERAEGDDLQGMVTGIGYSRLQQLVAYVLAAEFIACLSVLDNHSISRRHGINHFGQQVAILLNKEKPFGTHLFVLDKHLPGLNDKSKKNL